ncbi:MAG: hypothetical protein HZB82_02230 [Deltaproteobacteria bacterium]|nr:hypothetical protein [Deltaproteobacteria bacterium]
MLDIDITVVYQIAGYLILLAILHPLLYKPIIKLLKDREEKIGGSLKSAEIIEKEVLDGMAAYEKRIKDATIKGLEGKNRLMQQALIDERALLEKAAKEAAEELTVIRGRLSANKGSALIHLKKETGELSKNIAGKILGRNVAVMLIAFILPLLPLIAFAAEREEDHHGSSGEIWRLVTFIIVAVGVYFVWKKVVGPMLGKRAVDIEKAMADARAAKEAADRKIEEYKVKLAALEKRISEISEDLRKEGEAEKRRILAEAEKAVQKFKAQAQITIEQEIKKARLEIQAEVAELAVKMAEEILRKEIRPEDQDKLVRGYLENLRLN